MRLININSIFCTFTVSHVNSRSAPYPYFAVEEDWQKKHWASPVPGLQIPEFMDLIWYSVPVSLSPLDGICTFMPWLTSSSLGVSLGGSRNCQEISRWHLTPSEYAHTACYHICRTIALRCRHSHISSPFLCPLCLNSSILVYLFHEKHYIFQKWKLLGEHLLCSKSPWLQMRGDGYH